MLEQLPLEGAETSYLFFFLENRSSSLFSLLAPCYRQEPQQEQPRCAGTGGAATSDAGAAGRLSAKRDTRR
ncbi:MAG TPA: hypothetical protein VH164_13830 [Ktedonobacteraceae bacterium]|nr:hypothetical protein [Ktedonobacteraceae bacterium]